VQFNCKEAEEMKKMYFFEELREILFFF
jgi:hypothetical protein